MTAIILDYRPHSPSCEKMCGSMSPKVVKIFLGHQWPKILGFHHSGPSETLKGVSKLQIFENIRKMGFSCSNSCRNKTKNARNVEIWPTPKTNI